MRMSVGVDLHNSQFTVYWRSDDGVTGRHERYATSDDGYRRFEMALQSVVDRYCGSSGIHGQHAVLRATG